MKRVNPFWLFLGFILNVVIWSMPLALLSDAYMDLAAHLLNEPVSWPQIAFMSEYVTEARNGYFLFVAAVVTIAVLNSGLSVLMFGASPGKALLGIAYETVDGSREATWPLLLKRCKLLVGLILVIMTPGPILGFIFGPAADVFSLLALFFGVCFVIWMITPRGLSGERPSPLNQISGLQPVMKK